MDKAQLDAIREDNECLRSRLVVIGRDGQLRMSWDEAADGVDRTHKLLAEVDRLRVLVADLLPWAVDDGERVQPAPIPDDQMGDELRAVVERARDVLR